MPHLKKLIESSLDNFQGWSIWLYVRHPPANEVCEILKTYPHVFFCDTRNIPTLGNLKRSTMVSWKVGHSASLIFAE